MAGYTSWSTMNRSRSIEDLDSDEVGRLTLSGQTMRLTKRAQENLPKQPVFFGKFGNA